MDEELGKKLAAEAQELFDERKRVIEPVWKQIAEVLIPELQDLDGSKTIDALLAPGHYDGSPRSALEVASNTLFSLMCGPGTNWIQFYSKNKELMNDREARIYLDDLRTLVLKTLRENGFYQTAKPAIKYALALGTVNVTVTSEPEEDSIDYMLWHPGDTALSVGKNGRPDNLVIKQKVKIEDLLKYDEIPQKYLDLIIQGKGKELVNVYFFFKKIKREEDNVLGGKFKYNLFHVLETGEIILHSGMMSQPGAIWLFEKTPRLSYGLCPGYYVLRDVLQSNKLRKIAMMEAEKEAKPPLWVPRTTAGKFYTEPGSINYYDPGTGQDFPKRVFDRADLTGIKEMQLEIKQIVNTHFLIDFFNALTYKTKRVTAVEVQGLSEEMSQQVSYIVQTIEDNFLRPIVLRTLLILEEKKKLPEMPTSIKQEDVLGLQFAGPLSIADRYLYKSQQAHRVLNEALAPLGAIAPEEVKDQLNVRAFIELVADGIGGGSAILRSEKEVEEIQAQRAAAAQQQAEVEQAAMLQKAGGMNNGPEQPAV